MYQYDYVRVIGTGVVATKFEEHREIGRASCRERV